MWPSAAALLVGGGLGAAVAAVLALRALLTALADSIQPQPPTARQAEEEDWQANPLLRHVPGLRGKVAWRLNGQFPTPVCEATMRLDDTTEPGAGQDDKATTTTSTATGGGRARARFLVKREGQTSRLYGGNKARTLCFQLGACEALLEADPATQLYVLGSTGSNQCVATLVHGYHYFNIPDSRIHAQWVAKDEPDDENTLNLLSCLSFPGAHRLLRGLEAPRLLWAMWRDNKSVRVFPPGGSNVTGQLGQVGAMLELVEQIVEGRGALASAAPTDIVLAVGSTCTLTGLIVGACLARALGLHPLPGLTLHGVVVHHALAAGQRHLNLLRSRRIPLAVGWSIRRLCAFLARHGAPDVTDAALAFLDRDVDFICDRATVGTYGTHSERSRAAKAHYDRHCSLRGLWLCGHFTAKTFVGVLDFLRAQRDGDGRCVLMWDTKSVVQPRGPVNEWERFQSGPATLRRWARGADSRDGYLHRMTALGPDAAAPSS